jgi:hypothetical protein
MPERSLDDLLNGIYRLNVDEVEAAHRTVDLTLQEQVEAFYQGTCAVADFYEKVLIPFHLLKRTQREEVALGLVLRIASSLKSLAVMNSPVHFQSAMTGARTIFELIVSLAALSQENGDSLAERLVAFTDIERYRSDEEVDRYESERSQKGYEPTTAAPTLKVVRRNLETNRQRVAQLKAQYFSKGPSKKVGQWEWAGEYRLDRLVRSLGGIAEHLYSLHYPRLSWYAHGSSLVGTHSLSADSFERLFFMAHDIARECAVAAALFYGKIVGLDKVDEFARMIENVKEVPGAAMILAKLGRYRQAKSAESAPGTA